LFFFVFNTPATTDIYPLSLHDALPIYVEQAARHDEDRRPQAHLAGAGAQRNLQLGLGEVIGLAADRDVDDLVAIGHQQLRARGRSEEHTSELQSRRDLVCRLLLEKKKE